MHHGLQAGLPFVTAKHVASQLPVAGLFGSDDVKTSYNNFHQLKAKDIDGNEVNFADLNGKVGQPAEGSMVTLTCMCMPRDRSPFLLDSSMGFMVQSTACILQQEGVQISSNTAAAYAFCV